MVAPAGGPVVSDHSWEDPVAPDVAPQDPAASFSKDDARLEINAASPIFLFRERPTIQQLTTW